MDEAGLFGPLFQSVILDASGNGQVEFQATDKKLQITNVSVICSTAFAEATATVYKNNVAPLSRISGTFAGSSGDSNPDSIYLDQGQKVIIVWSGGDVGATATATISGWASVPGRGFRAVH
jgi:hypothetical protein